MDKIYKIRFEGLNKSESFYVKAKDYLRAIEEVKYFMLRIFGLSESKGRDNWGPKIWEKRIQGISRALKEFQDINIYTLTMFIQNDWSGSSDRLAISTFQYPKSIKRAFAFFPSFFAKNKCISKNFLIELILNEIYAPIFHNTLIDMCRFTEIFANEEYQKEFGIVRFKTIAVDRAVDEEDNSGDVAMEINEGAFLNQIYWSIQENNAIGIDIYGTPDEDEMITSLLQSYPDDLIMKLIRFLLRTNEAGELIQHDVNIYYLAIHYLYIDDKEFTVSDLIRRLVDDQSSDNAELRSAINRMNKTIRRLDDLLIDDNE